MAYGYDASSVLQSDSLQTASSDQVLPDLERSEGVSFINILKGMFGLLVLIGIGYLFSNNRKKINWRIVGTGLLIQILLAVGILQISFIQSFFEIVGGLFVKVLDSTVVGSQFLFGDIMNEGKMGFIFAFQILPTIVFFSAITSLLFYLGVIQFVVKIMAKMLTAALKISGAEGLSVAGNIFLGQTESPLLIKAYLPKMSRSEIMLVMTGGMATLAGGVLASYIGFLGGTDPVQRLLFAKHLLAASVMAAPGAVVVSKLLVPQVEEVNKDVVVNKELIGNNVLDAISTGTWEGLRLAVNVGAMILVFIAFMALINIGLDYFGATTGLNNSIAVMTDGQYEGLSLQFLLGYLFSPIMWLIGVTSADITLMGRLLGEKLILTEFIGYISLAELKASGAFTEYKSVIMATYMLCGFANVASIGIQIGGIGSLAPNQRLSLSQLGVRALLGGTLASLISATMVGMILG